MIELTSSFTGFNSIGVNSSNMRKFVCLSVRELKSSKTRSLITIEFFDWTDKSLRMVKRKLKVDIFVFMKWMCHRLYSKPIEIETKWYKADYQ